MLLSGIGKIFNRQKYTFPLKLSIEAILQVADQFVLAVCDDSEDDTIEYCNTLQKSFNGKLKLIHSHWIIDPAEGKFNMKRLADLAIENTDTEWFISVDMDEVYRTEELKKLKIILQNIPKDYGGCAVSFVHHYIDPYHRIFGKLYDRSARVGRKSMGWKSYDDGFGITGEGKVYMADVTCNHYGFVRSAKSTIEKELNFQETLYKPLHSQFPDPRLVEYMEKVKKGEEIDKEKFYNYMTGDKDFIVPYGGQHYEGVLQWYESINK